MCQFANLLVVIMLWGWLAPSAGLAQDIPHGKKLTRAEKTELRKQTEAEEMLKVRQLIKSSDFVLVPNQVSGNNVNPIMNFICISGDTLIFQTSSPFDRAKSNNLLTDKTVVGKITTISTAKNQKNGYSSLKINIMTAVGIGFHIDMKISPFGQATAWIAPNNMAGRLDFQGRIVAMEESDIHIGPESFDLTNFPWYTNPYITRWVDR